MIYFFHGGLAILMFCSTAMLPRLHAALIAKGNGDRMEVAPGYLSVLASVTRQEAV